MRWTSPAISSPAIPKAPDDSYIIRLKRHAFDLGLDISGTGVRNDFTAADKAVRAEGVQRIKNWIEVAAKLGAPTIRVFADSQPPFKNWQKAAGNASAKRSKPGWPTRCASAPSTARKFGVIVAVQNHGDFISTGAEHLSLLKRVDHEWCAALVDTGKYLTADPYADIAMMAPYAVNWQIKETLRQHASNRPRTDMQEARQDHPRGRLSRIRADRDPLDGPQGLRSLRRGDADADRSSCRDSGNGFPA